MAVHEVPQRATRRAKNLADLEELNERN